MKTKGSSNEKGGIKMNKARNATWFVLGVLVTVMISQFALPAGATLPLDLNSRSRKRISKSTERNPVRCFFVANLDQARAAVMMAME